MLCSHSLKDHQHCWLRPPSSQEQIEASRNVIIHAPKALFALHGYESVTTRGEIRLL